MTTKIGRYAFCANAALTTMLLSLSLVVFAQTPTPPPSAASTRQPLEDAAAARAARGSKEPSLGAILARTGFAGTDTRKIDEILAQHFMRADATKPVVHRPIASFGLLKSLQSGYSIPGPPDATAPMRTLLWIVTDRYNKQDAPPLVAGTTTQFSPKRDQLFTLWVSTGGFKNEYVSTNDKQNADIARFGGKPIRKAHVFVARDNEGKIIENAYIIGWEYSTNDDNQDIVTIVENVRPATILRKTDIRSLNLY